MADPNDLQNFAPREGWIDKHLGEKPAAAPALTDHRPTTDAEFEIVDPGDNGHLYPDHRPPDLTQADVERLKAFWARNQWKEDLSFFARFIAGAVVTAVLGWLLYPWASHHAQLAFWLVWGPLVTVLVVVNLASRLLK